MTPLLHQQRQAMHLLPHIRVVQCDPQPRAARDHRKPFSAAATSIGDASSGAISNRERSRLPRSRHHADPSTPPRAGLPAGFIVPSQPTARFKVHAHSFEWLGTQQGR